MSEAFGLSLVMVALVWSACRISGLCNWRARRRERLIEVCLVLLGLIQDLQLHRGLSGAVMAKRRDFRSDLEANEYKLLRSLDAVGERYGRHHTVFRDKRWRIVLGRWEALRNNWRGLSFDTSLLAHGEVIGGVIEILISLSEENQQLLGDRYAHCIAKWPRLIEDLGLLRAMGLNLLSQSPTHADQPQIEKIAAQLSTGRARLPQIADSIVDRALIVRTERAFQRVSWLLDGNAERYHPYTFYEEMNAVIDDWYGLLRNRLQEVAPSGSVTDRLVEIIRPHPKTG